MIIYWSMIAVIAIFAILGQLEYNAKGTHSKYGTPYASFSIIVPILYIVFWTGIRNRFVDTAAYIATYNSIPIGNLDTVKMYMTSIEEDKGFYLFAALFKNYVSTNYHWWLFIIALISGLCLYRIIRRQADHPHFALFLFMTTCTFSWLMNGIRQFLAICILFAFSDWLLSKKKRIWYIVLIFAVSTIHISALYALPFIIIVSLSKAWDKRMLMFIACMLVMIVFSEKLMPSLVSSLADDYSATYATNEGSSWIRTLVALVPVGLTFVKRKEIQKLDEPYMEICVNMSIVSACIYGLASVSDGILVGRMPMFFQVYNLILLPWVLAKCYKGSTKKILIVACVVCYLMYFVYQTYFAGGYYYSSDITGFIP